MKTRYYLYILTIFTLVSCEGSKPARMIDSFEYAIEEHNNGDSTSLIILIIGCLIVAVLWLKNNKDKS